MSVYRLAQSSLPKATELCKFDGANLILMPGPFGLVRSVPIYHYGSGSVAMTMGIEQVPFPQGMFLLIQHDLVPLGFGQEQAQARIQNSELIALLDLEFSGFVVEKLFEGAVSRPGHFTLAPEGPMKVATSRSISVDQLKLALSAGTDRLLSLHTHDRQRLRLMSRWYRRAKETLNRVDQFLFLYVAIEVFPASGRTDVPGAVRDYLAQHVFPSTPPFEIKERLMLGPIAGFRAEIVHDGKSSVASSEEKDFSEKLQCLEVIARECMSLLAGRPYSGSLDQWVCP